MFLSLGIFHSDEISEAQANIITQSYHDIFCRLLSRGNVERPSKY